MSNSVHKLQKNLGLILVIGLICALAAALLSLVFPREYRADAQVLIISKTRYGVDPYTVVKSAERIGENLVQVMSTNDFFEKVMSQTNYSLDQSNFEGISERKKRKRWSKTIAPSVVYGTGVLNVSAFSKSADQAKQLTAASVDALVSHGWEYVGGDVSIKIVNDPVATKWPARPNIFVNALAGLLLGLFFAGAFVARA